MSKKLSEETKRVLLALYAAIDAEGGVPSTDFERGYGEGLEMALTHIDMILNEHKPIDEAWIEEGWKRFSARLDAIEKQGL